MTKLNVMIVILLALLEFSLASLKPSVIGVVNRKRRPSAPVRPLKLLEAQTICRPGGIELKFRSERRFTGFVSSLLDPNSFKHEYRDINEAVYHLCYFDGSDNGEQFGLRANDDVTNDVKADGSFSRLLHDVDVLPDLRTREVDGQKNVPACELFLEKGSAFGNVIVPGSFKADIVLQAHGLHAPQLVTHQDQIVSVSCDYTEFLRKEFFNSTDRFFPGAFVGGFEQIFPSVENGEKVEMSEKTVVTHVDDLAEARFELLPPLEEYDFIITHLATSSLCDNLSIIKEGCPVANLSDIAYVGGVQPVSRTAKVFNLLPMDFVCDTRNGIVVHFEYVVCKGSCHVPVCPGQESPVMEEKPEIKLTIRKLSQERAAAPPVPIEANDIETVCRNDGIHLRINTRKPIHGEIYLLDYYDSCHLQVVNQTEIIFNLGRFGRKRAFNQPLHMDDFEHSGNCSLRWALGDIPYFSAQVVVAQNGLRTPELLTSADRVFKVSCDYGPRRAGAAYGLGRAVQVFPAVRGLPSPFQQQVVDANGELSVDLDEVLQLEFEMAPPPHADYRDFLLKECTIGRRSRLKYVENGCIPTHHENQLVHGNIVTPRARTKAFKAQPFLFLDDPEHGVVDVQCTFEYCVGPCEQPDCAAVAEEEKEAERPTVSINVAKLSVSAEESPTPVIPTHFIQTLCTSNGIHVEVRNREAFDGRFYAMHRYEECQQHSEHSGVVNMFLGLPADFSQRVEQPDCAVREFDAGSLGQFLVLEADEAGMDGLITPLSRIYWVQCNYSGFVELDADGKRAVNESMEPFFGQTTAVYPQQHAGLAAPDFQLLEEPFVREAFGMELLNGDQLHQLYPTERLQLEFVMAPSPHYAGFMLTDCWFGNDHGARDQRVRLVGAEGCAAAAPDRWAPLLPPEPIKAIPLDRKVVLDVYAFMNRSHALKRAFDFECQLWFCERDCPTPDCRPGHPEATAAALLHPFDFLSRLLETRK